MPEHRLPDGVRPTHYALHLTADPEAPTFTGVVDIDVAVHGSTAIVEMHAEGLKINAVRIDQGGPKDCRVRQEGDRLRLQVSGALSKGVARIHLEYTGKVRHDMAGLYLSKDGDRSCLATQCEATDARSIVPCWDEPAYKATWQWTVTAPSAMTVLTNGALNANEVDGQQTTHRFDKVGPMSSYLIAACIGDFAASKTEVARDTDFRVWAMRGQEQHGHHGNDLASRMLPWYEDYFGQSYAFGKYDQIAVPSFAFGAMENAGLVLFRPSLLLIDERSASWDEQRHVALVVAHEFAHMWFGNLVTMAWWDDLWLNEAFAEWIAHKCADAMDPTLDVWVPFRQRAAGALSTDALSSTHAIYHPVKTPEEAKEMFDAITYGKGSAVMRMLEAYLGDDAFRQGLRTYMEQHRFGNAEGEDLWHHLGNVSHQDVAGIMGDWVKQAGHPTITCSWDGRLHITQARTTSSPLIGDQPGTWQVPMVIRYEDDSGIKVHRHLMCDAQETVDLAVDGDLKWLWANAEDGGFYRVALDDGLRGNVLQDIDSLHPAEQVGFVRDSWMAVRNGKADLADFLEIFDTVLGDRHYEVVEFMGGVLRMLDGMLHGHDEQAAFRSWVASRLRDIWHNDRSETAPGRQRRAAFLRSLGLMADDVAVEAARGIAAMERTDEVVDPQLAGAAVAVEALNGDLETLDTFLAAYDARREAAAPPQEVERYLYALAAFRDPACTAKVLELLANKGVAAQAEGPILRAMLASVDAGRAAWHHLQADWPELEGRLGEAWLAIIVEACGELPVDLADDVKAFWDEHLGGRAAQSYSRAQERLAERAELEARIGDDLRAWALALSPTATT